MTFAEWQQLSPADAARELHRRVRQTLSPPQQRAAIAALQPEARLRQAFARANRRPPLGGVPYFAKDLFDVPGQLTFAGSKFLPQARPTPAKPSAFVADLLGTGAVLAGKTQLHEFAYGITGENPHHGDCEHPNFPGHTTGGSSSGSAAVVAAGIAPLALGTDTGGSIRVPAAFCGLYGFRLTPGHRWISDAVPLAGSFDTPGWFTDNAPDMATTLRALVESETATTPPRGCYFEPNGVDPEIANACREVATRFTSLADESTRAELSAGFSGTSAVYNTIVAAEAWSYHRSWFDRYHGQYDPAVAQRIERGMRVTEPELTAARASADAVRAVWSAFFARYDFLVMPAVPFAALRKAACTPENRGRLLDLTTPVSVGGLPALTLPVTLPSGMTAGLQIVASTAKSPVFLWALSQ